MKFHITRTLAALQTSDFTLWVRLYITVAVRRESLGGKDVPEAAADKLDSPDECFNAKGKFLHIRLA